MAELNRKRLEEIIHNGSGRRLMVVGDLMIDRYLWGNVSRISPEAPVPIINIEEEEIRFGGAANVANNIIGLNAEPVLVGVVGSDQWGEVFRKMLTQKGLPSSGLITDINRPTTIKTRIIGNNQHIARGDREKTEPINRDIQIKLLEYVESVINEIDALILQDYNKGVIVSQLVKEIITLANRHNKIVTVDPKFDNFWAFQNVTVFKPNKKETEEALAMRLDNWDNIIKAGEILIEKLKAQAALITLGEQGMALFEKGKGVSFSQTRARKVADVSGAGDTVIATLTSALAAGAEMQEAVTLANFAAAIVCQEVGVAPIQKEQLLNAM